MGPVGVVEGEGAAVVRVMRVLDGDRAGNHGDDTSTACILLSLETVELDNIKLFYSENRLQVGSK